MTPDRFRECLDLLHWSQRGLATILDTHPTTARRWAMGAEVIPANVASWLSDLADHAAQHALPEGWQRRAA